MMLSEQFSLTTALYSQTASVKGIDNIPTPEVIEAMKYTAQGLEKVVDVLGTGITVTSWYRCMALNQAVGGVPTSQHLKGEAVDFICPAFGTPLEICRALVESGLGFDQIIHEHAWVHISFSLQPRNNVLELVKGGGYRDLVFK